MMDLPLCNNRKCSAPVFFGKTFFLCWRCSGFSTGVIFGIFSTIKINNVLIFFFIFVFIVDGCLSYNKNFGSSNLRRFFSGLFAGIVAATVLSNTGI